MINKKETGSYYTPINLAKFIADYCLCQINKKNISILEPSVGDGNFIEAINDVKDLENFKKIELTVVERENAELQKAIKKNNNKKITLKSYNSDYLNFHFQNDKKYTLILGNPPYVKRNLLSEEQIELSQKIHSEQNLSLKTINNVWTPFLVSAISKLDKKGVLAFVLPLELLQVKFTEEIRELLKKSFQRLEIFMFEELQFQECKGQDTVLLIGYKKHIQNGTFYTTIKTIEDLHSRSFSLYTNISVSESGKKWTNHFITPEEYSFLENIKKELKLVSHYVDNKPGIVTAANDFFIVDKETIQKYNLERFSKPILQKGFFVNGSVTFTSQDHERLILAGKPAYLLDFKDLETDSIPADIEEYLTIGKERELHDRFKCKQRNFWYKIPNINKQAAAFFFKRSHEYPKILKNEAEVFVTDSAYMIEAKDTCNLNDFIYSFYNSLTLAFAELEGRYYGGGVLELTPNEFRSLPIPMIKVSDFESYAADFKNKSNIEDLLSKYNFEILNRSLNLNSHEIDRIEQIRKKLVNKRHRK
ncbi:Eco57I restriction-modification methylase domain-containing protein [Flavobacterium sharifuzzamanii]|uniref:Eco57I restriction-modification methylase domain-containing protein n=1 Tax=Flavobacterium sharifuzzamanii TaxID=2211133 RepID=UPI000DAB3DB4|nr:N-6 DNA methylase [Flavobacterium sharifuzzamanii]KAF2082012.1 N-6 DNA methylase [Flavobacterium sharifuzzamanii]